ncbi:MAG: RNA methyltransferase [Bacteroidales bacterium]|nr:RNA methyltransferase [Bacteroidales bacterium]
MTQLTAARIKFIKSLSQKKFRNEEKLFTVEGEKIVEEAEKSGFKIVEKYYRDEIGDNAMSRITSLSSPSPVLAVVEQKNISFDEYINSTIAVEKGLYLALDDIKDPGNLGTIIRIADWFGIDAIFASNETVELYNPKVVQATMGAIFRKKVIYCNLQKALSALSDKGLPIYGTFLNGENIHKKKLTPNGVIVIGNESNGISKAVEKTVGERLYIPPYPAGAVTSESLNAAIATAITCYTFRKG